MDEETKHYADASFCQRRSRCRSSCKMSQAQYHTNGSCHAPAANSNVTLNPQQSVFFCNGFVGCMDFVESGCLDSIEAWNAPGLRQGHAAASGVAGALRTWAKNMLSVLCSLSFVDFFCVLAWIFGQVSKWLACWVASL